jgi:hypothetical protein
MARVLGAHDHVEDTHGRWVPRRWPMRSARWPGSGSRRVLGSQVPAVSGLSTASRLASGRAAAAIGDAVPAGLIAGGVPELLSGPAVPA